MYGKEKLTNPYNRGQEKKRSYVKSQSNKVLSKEPTRKTLIPKRRYKQQKKEGKSTKDICKKRMKSKHNIVPREEDRTKYSSQSRFTLKPQFLHGHEEESMSGSSPRPFSSPTDFLEPPSCTCRTSRCRIPNIWRLTAPGYPSTKCCLLLLRLSLGCENVGKVDSYICSRSSRVLPRRIVCLLPFSHRLGTPFR